MSTVCVHGLGYVGLPTAAMLANYGYEVYGYDVDDCVRDSLRDGEIHFDEPGLRAFVTQALESGGLEITDEVVPAKYQVICVPTPFDEESKTADLTFVEEAGRAVASVLREGDVVVLESTVPPGTSTDELRPILEASGLVAGDGFALVHCPETVLPGDIITELQENSRIVGGIDDASAEAAARLYESFVDGEIRTTSDPTVAEFVKLIQNTYRDVNIAFANEIAMLAHEYGIDSREAIALANEHPRVEILQPGPGVGGHCLPIDPWFLGVGSKDPELIATARAVNDGMTEFVANIVRSEIAELGHAKVAILGIAYKANVSDVRMSPGLRLADELRNQPTAGEVDSGDVTESPTVVVHDPYVSDQSVDLSDFESATADADALVVTTDHDEYRNLDPSDLFEQVAGDVVVDTRACLDASEWREAGFSVRTV